jgi:hypothetical protein
MQEFEGFGGTPAEFSRFVGELGTDYTFLGYDGSVTVNPEALMDLAKKYLFTADEVPRFLKYWCTDDKFAPQGEAVMRIEATSSQFSKTGVWFTGFHLMASDSWYQSWAVSDACGPEDAAYHLCAGPCADCPEKWEADEQLAQIHISKWEVSCPKTEMCVRWFCGRSSCSRRRAVVTSRPSQGLRRWLLRMSAADLVARGQTAVASPDAVREMGAKPQVPGPSAALRLHGTGVPLEVLY